MAVPKYKSSKARTSRRKSINMKKVAVSPINCTHCGKLIERHIVCAYCGHYKGKQWKKVVQST